MWYFKNYSLFLTKILFYVFGCFEFMCTHVHMHGVPAEVRRGVRYGGVIDRCQWVMGIQPRFSGGTANAVNC